MGQKLVAKATMRMSARELRLALETRKEDEAAVLFFLAGAARDGAMYQGRRAHNAFEAACRLLSIDADQRALIEDALV